MEAHIQNFVRWRRKRRFRCIHEQGWQAVVATTPSEPKTITIDLFANFAQFVYDDENPENPFGPGVRAADSANRRVHARLAGRRKVNFTKTVYFQLAPTIYNYTGNGDTFNKHFSGDPDFIDAADSEDVTQSDRHQQPAGFRYADGDSVGQSANSRCASSATSPSTSMPTSAPPRPAIRTRAISAMPTRSDWHREA